MPFLPMAALILIYNDVQLPVGHQNKRREAFKRVHMSCYDVITGCIFFACRRDQKVCTAREENLS